MPNLQTVWPVCLYTTVRFWMRPCQQRNPLRSMETGSTQTNLPAFVHHKAFCVRDKHLFCLWSLFFFFVDGNSIQLVFFSNSVVKDNVQMNSVWSQTALFPKTPTANIRDETRGDSRLLCFGVCLKLWKLFLFAVFLCMQRVRGGVARGRSGRFVTVAARR